MSTKYYRVKKDNFLWKEGCILQSKNGCCVPLDETTIWDMEDNNEGEYISQRVVASRPDWFEEVYKVDTFSKTMYMVKEKAQEFFSKQFKSESE